LALAVTPSLAVGQSPAPLNDPSNAAHGDDTPGEGTGARSAAGGTSGPRKQIGSLPFTGMDLLIVSGVALVLTGTGLALRRLSIPPGADF
jgi:hypothetical protein